MGTKYINSLTGTTCYECPDSKEERRTEELERYRMEKEESFKRKVISLLRLLVCLSVFTLVFLIFSVVLLACLR